MCVIMNIKLVKGWIYWLFVTVLKVNTHTYICTRYCIKRLHKGFSIKNVLERKRKSSEEEETQIVLE